MTTVPDSVEKKTFRKIDVPVPVLGMGTWQLGGFGDDPIPALKRGLELGMTLIDTAEAYGSGQSERLIREAIAGFDRSKLFIVSKVRESRPTREDILKAAQASVERLGTTIDLYLLHWPPTDRGLNERMKGLEDVAKHGLTKHIGVSNFTVELIEEARSYLSNIDIVAVQNRMSITYHADLGTVIPYAQREGMMYMAYSPLERGRIGELATEPRIDSVAKRYGKTAIQVALNWLICIDPVVPIPKAGKIKHIEEDAGAIGWRLSREDWANLNS
jgi:diketogulonate reductase-like aldo/keto reductase